MAIGYNAEGNGLVPIDRSFGKNWTMVNGQCEILERSFEVTDRGEQQFC